jgi:ferredoxin
MTYVITRLCQDCVDGACVAVCPVSDCIVEHRPEGRSSELPNQLFISPVECIHCGACEPECPWDAIFDEDDVPLRFKEDIALNAISAAKPKEFVEAAIRTSRRPTLEEVQANKLRWDAHTDKSG